MRKTITERDGQAKARGYVSRVRAVDPRNETVIVEGVNFRYRHLRKGPKHPQGGRLEKEMPIHISNVMLYCEHCKKGVRVKRRKAADGTAMRVCRKCDQAVGGS